MKLALSVLTLAFVALFIFDQRELSRKDKYIESLNHHISAKDTLIESLENLIAWKDSLMVSQFECTWNRGVNSGMKYVLSDKHLGDSYNEDKADCFGSIIHISTNK